MTNYMTKSADMKLSFLTGRGEDGKVFTQNRTYKGLRVDVTAEEIQEAATLISSLRQHTLQHVQVILCKELV